MPARPAHHPASRDVLLLRIAIRQRLMRILLALVAVCLPTAPLCGINIRLNFDSNQTESPNFDANASGLISMFQFAEDFYEDVFEDSDHTLDINFWYEDLSNNTLGVHNTLAVFGRETSGDIRIDTRVGTGGAFRNWFIDPTPADNSEFNMQQQFWRNLNGTQKADFYSGFTDATMPETFEVAFTGTAVNGATVGLQNDMLSTVLHEVGHALGMSSGNLATIFQTTDGDYDFLSDFIFGQTLAVETANNSGDDNANIAHLESPNALMSPSNGVGVRSLPSHTDLFAMAAGHNYLDLDVPRREFYGNSNWQNPDNWTGHALPGSGDEVFIRAAQGADTITTRLNANATAGDINVSEGANLDTNEFKLDVTRDVTVTDPDSDIFINPSGELEADELFIRNSSEVEMNGGLIDVRRLVIDAGTQIEGTSGSMTVDVSSRLVNNGEIDANGGSVMTFVSSGTNVWDLDGGGDGVVDALNGDINFDSGRLSDDFDGTMFVGSGRHIRIAEPWESEGAIHLAGGNSAATQAELRGGKFTMAGGSLIATGVNEIDAATEFRGNASVAINGTSSVLSLGNMVGDGVTYAGGTFSGDGTLIQDGDATVAAGATVHIAVASFDWDGGTVSDTTIESGATLNITSREITDAHDGVIRVNGGTANVAPFFTINSPPLPPINRPVPWTMNGQLNLTNGGVLSGSPVTMNGDIDVTSRGIVESSIRFNASSSVSVDSAGDILELRGTTTYDGGTYGGGGRIEQDGSASVVSDTSLGGPNLGERLRIYDWDGAGADAEGGTMTIQPGVALTINADQIDVNPETDGYDDTLQINSGTLVVNTGELAFTPPPLITLVLNRAPWRLDGVMNLNNTGAGTPTVDGSTMVARGTVNVTGGAARIDAIVEQQTGQIDIDGSSTLALNRVFTQNGGTLAIDSGGAVNAADGFVVDGGSGTINGTLTLNESTHFIDGSYGGGGTIVHNDSTNIGPGAGIGVSSFVIGSSGRVNMTGGNITTRDFVKQSGGGLTFDGGQIVVTEGTAVMNSSFTFSGPSEASQPTFRIEDGAETTVTFAWRTGETVDEFGRTVVSGTSSGGDRSTLRGTGGGGGADLIVGNAGTGVLDVFSGGLVHLRDDFIVGNAAGSRGTATVRGVATSGARAEVDVSTGTSSVIEVGRSGEGTLAIENGGLVRTSADAVIGRSVGSDGTITVGGSAGGFDATLDVADDLFVGGTSAAAGGNGRLIVEDGGKVIVGDDVIVQSPGVIEVLGGSFDPDLLTIDGGRFTQTAGGTAIVSSAGTTTDAGLFVGLPGGQGTVIVKNGGQLQTSATKIGDAAGGTGSVAVVGAGSSFEVTGTLTVADGGTLDVDLGDVSAGRFDVESGGTLTGSGTIHAPYVNDGLLSPGDSPGLLSLATTFEQTDNGTLLIELGGLAPQTQYDRLAVAGDATLGGTLQVELLDLGGGLFEPAAGDQFTVITSGGELSGPFATELLPALTGGLSWSVNYLANALRLDVLDILFNDADFDEDGDVDGEDFLRWQSNFGLQAGATHMQGDADGDGDVDGEDFLRWQSSFGSSQGASAAAVTASVPEPSALGLAALILAASLRRPHPLRRPS